MGVASSFPSIVNELYEHTIIHESMHANVFGYSGAMPLNSGYSFLKTFTLCCD